ncbi:MAG TPA: iron-sulfur cluster assembly scaffold protein [Patescibacteria group bacterium]|nr:iron-sulfur cluster assembly scaffold protein [Patescibacteria group bacterium]
MSDIDELYQEQILEHYKHPKNKTRVLSGKGKTFANPGCGDTFCAQIIVSDGKVTSVTWTGEGCAVSSASMSMISQWLLGKTASELRGTNFADLAKEVGLPNVLPAREKCVRMGWRLVEEAVLCYT